MILRRILLAIGIFLSLGLGAHALNTSVPWSVSNAPVTITGMSITCGSSCSIPNNVPPGTAYRFGAINVLLSAGTFAGTVELVSAGGSCSGGDISHFEMLGNPPNNVNPPNRLAAYNPPLTAGSHVVCIRATQPNIANSPQYLQVTVTQL